jgi:hypothetical protein
VRCVWPRAPCCGAAGATSKLSSVWLTACSPLASRRVCGARLGRWTKDKDHTVLCSARAQTNPTAAAGLTRIAGKLAALARRRQCMSVLGRTAAHRRETA